MDLLFKRVLNLDGFLSLSSGQYDYSHQLLCKVDIEKIPSVQALLEESLFEQVLKFKVIPNPVLILQMPRSGNKFKMFKGILTNLSIDITDLLQNCKAALIQAYFFKQSFNLQESFNCAFYI